jgi:hypothetical protein
MRNEARPDHGWSALSSFRLHPLNVMLTHIVIWKYRPDVEREVREEHVRMLRSLSSVIKEVERLAVGFDVVKLPRSFDIGLVALFRDRAALDAYTIHPRHIKVAAFGKTISEQVASVDFDSTSSEATQPSTHES